MYGFDGICLCTYYNSYTESRTSSHYSFVRHYAGSDLVQWYWTSCDCSPYLEIQEGLVPTHIESVALILLLYLLATEIFKEE